jgi:hypothetical protein
MRSRSLLTFVSIIVGSFFYWGIKGFTGKWSCEFSRAYDLDRKYYRNLITGLLIIVALILMILPPILKWLYTE